MMKAMKRIMLAMMTVLLIVSMSTQAEAGGKKTNKPTVRVVNGTVIVELKNASKNHYVTFRFYYKNKKGKWADHHTEDTGPDGTSTRYAEVLKDGTYAVTAEDYRYKESDKVVFKVVGTGKNMTDEEIFYTGFTNDDNMYTLTMDSEKKVGVYSSDLTKEGAKKITICAYYLDSKGKLHLIGNKKMKKDKHGFYAVSFPMVKGQRNYAFSQVNEKGKVLGYLHTSLDTKFKVAEAWHHGFPSKKMKYNQKDWSYY